MDYKIIRRDSPAELEDAVNAYINQGWELVGGVSVAVAYSHYKDCNDYLTSSETNIWAQAIKRVTVSETLNTYPQSSCYSWPAAQ